MNNKNIELTVFTKPWKHLSINELGKLVSEFGFDGIEFPLREGYQIEPENAEKGLPLLARQLGENGLKINSITGILNEKVFAGCQAAKIPIIRIIVKIDLKKGYFVSIEKAKRELDNIIPLCEKYNVKIGIQQHFGPGLNNSMELLTFIEKYNPRHIGAIWDSAHSAYAGEEPEQALEIVESYLCMINLKNVFYRLNSGPDAEDAKWDYYFCSARKGLASWTRIAEYLKSKDYKGIICLTAEYTEAALVNRLIREDINYAKTLFL